MITPGRHQEQVVEKFIGQPWCFIGDSMGVGKTLSGVLLDIAERKYALEEGQERFKTLIVCTKAGLEVWRWHLVDQGIDPGRIFVIDPMDRAPFALELEHGANNYDYYLMHYQVLELVPYFEKPQIGRNALVWDHIILDEAQHIKNRNGKRTKTIKRQKAKKKTLITGTPADDKPQDIWSLLNFGDRKKYSSYWRFVDEYVAQDRGYNASADKEYRRLLGPKNVEKFHSEIHPYYIRRTLPEVRGSMPPKTHSRQWVDMTERQMRDYQDMEKFQLARIGEEEEEYVVEWSIVAQMRLQQMTVGTAIELDWSFYERFWEKHKNTPEEELPEGAPSGPRVIIGEPSPKVDLVMELVETALDSGESIVVMSRLRDVVKMVEARCKKLKISLSTLHGGMTNIKDRNAQIAAFQSRKTRVFAGTIGAAGTSITLTAASMLVFTDRHWNPSVNRQAEDRIWRYDTQDPVQIIDICARDTIDSSKLDAIKVKGKRIDDLVEIPEKFKRMGVLL